MPTIKIETGELLGAEIISIREWSTGIEIVTSKGVLRTGHGDCGTLRNPEPYNYLTVYREGA